MRDLEPPPSNTPALREGYVMSSGRTTLSGPSFLQIRENVSPGMRHGPASGVLFFPVSESRKLLRRRVLVRRKRNLAAHTQRPSLGDSALGWGAGGVKAEAPTPRRTATPHLRSLSSTPGSRRLRNRHVDLTCVTQGPRSHHTSPSLVPPFPQTPKSLRAPLFCRYLFLTDFRERGRER